ncbi:MAG: cell division ATP-binding protein FtsE [Sulfuricellaceae bacterium]|jgi:cell division transport system ATP-binding protein
MISFDQVSKSYRGGHEALRNLSFEIGDGELVVVTGHTGAGKTTLLNLIAAIERPTSGSVVVNGQNVGKMRRSAIPYLRRNLGLIFQDHKLLFDRTVFENVLLPLQISGFPHAEAAKRVRAALDKVGLLDREKAHPVTLSGGEQQRVCIARAIVNRPSILLADEPTGNLDPDYAHGIIEMFRSFHQVGVTILIATHDEHLIASLPARVLTLQHGALRP